jgi:hypothetical protein
MGTLGAILLTIALLVGGSMAISASLAAVARFVNRVWDAWDAWIGSGSAARGRPVPGRGRAGGARARQRLAIGVPRSVLLALLVTSILCGVAWLGYVLSRATQLG